MKKQIWVVCSVLDERYLEVQSRHHALNAAVTKAHNLDRVCSVPSEIYIEGDRTLQVHEWIDRERVEVDGLLPLTSSQEAKMLTVRYPPCAYPAEIIDMPAKVAMAMQAGKETHNLYKLKNRKLRSWERE